ncbi:MAG: SDR family NAD(P)-dependent oxidoreductase [Betaproteobacteria bacterium]
MVRPSGRAPRLPQERRHSPHVRKNPRFARDGCAVVLADVNEAQGRDHASRLKADFVKADLVEETLKKHGTIHILVNNAGFQHVAPIEEFPEERWDRMLFLMLTAPFLLTRYRWPAMKAAYLSAKHGLVGLTRTAALEGGEHGITVNAICPAYVRTALVDNQIGDQARANPTLPPTCAATQPASSRGPP